MAIKDAIQLSETLTQIMDDDEMIELLKQYEKEMADRAGKSVVRSRDSTFIHPGIFKK